MSLPEVTASGYIKGGRLMLHHRRQFDDAVRGLKDGWEVEIEIFRLRATRSRKQNAYYFGKVLKDIAEHTGHSASTLHELLKVKFLSRTEVVLDASGDVVDKFVLGKSTSGLKTDEFARYVDEIRQWAAEKLGCVIDDPDPSWRQRTEPQDDLEEAGYGAGV